MEKKDNSVSEKRFSGVTGHAKTFYVEIFPFQIDFQTERFIRSDNTEYNAELARFAVIAANAAYGKPHRKKRAGHISGDGEAFFEDLGFRDVKRLEAGDPETDRDDVAAFLIGHLRTEADGRQWEIIAVSLRGSVTGADWISDLDVGADTEAYTLLTGEHPEWTDRALHKGFSVTANRAQRLIDRYAEEYTDGAAEKIIFLTGHSRGAAVANILGKVFGERAEYKAFAYTFASPRTAAVTEEQAAEVRTVFNIVNENDMVPELPPSGWNGFRRYGRDIIFRGIIFHGNHRKLTGYSYQPAIGSETDRVLSELAASREALYEFDESGSYVRRGSCRTREQAEEALRELRKKAEAGGNEKYFRFLITEKERRGRTIREAGYICRPAYICRAAAELLRAGGLRELLRVKLFMFSKRYLEAGMKLALPVAEGAFVKSHMLPIYYGSLSEELGEKPRRALSPVHRIPALLKHGKLALLEGAGRLGLGILSLPGKVKRAFKKKDR